MTNEPHIGHEIARVAQQQGLSPTLLASSLGLTEPQAARLLARPSIDTDLLMTISRLLHHNFFALYQDALRSQEPQ